MKVQNIATSRNNVLFKGLITNKFALKSLEKISEHGATFSAAICTVMPLTVRPLAILATPNVEKENKLYACANSICSGLAKFGIVAAVSLPIEHFVKKIDKNPDKFLNEKTLKDLAKAEDITKNKEYKIATQIIKLSSNFVMAIPKSMITIALIPVIMGVFFNHKFSKNAIENKTNVPNYQQSNKPSFKSNISDKLTKSIGQILNKILDNEMFKNYISKNPHAEKDIAKHMSASTDILLSSAFVVQTSKSDKIKENRKKTLIYNNIISTSATLVGGYSIDKFIKNKTQKFIDRFAQANKNDPNLHKYIQGLNIVRPALIFAGIYYIILPVFSTYMAEKINKFMDKQTNK